MHRLRSLAEGTPPWLRWSLLFAAFLLLSTLAVVRYLPYQPEVSRADEYVFVDALDKALRWNVAQRGEMADPYAIELAACRGISQIGPIGSPCDGPLDPAEAPFGGLTSADIHSPVYFFATAALARVLLWTPYVEDILVAGRLVSAVWLALGLTLVVALARSVSARRSAALAVALLLMVAPSTRWTSTYITPDSLNFAAGALMLLVAVHVIKRRWHPLIAGVASAAVVAVKAQNLLAVGAAAVLLLLHAWGTRTSDRAGSRRALLAAIAALAAGIATQVTWLIVRDAIAVGPPADQGLDEGTVTWPAIGREAVNMMRSVVLSYDPGLSLFGEVVTWFLTAGVIAMAFFVVPHATGVAARLGQGTIVALIVGAPLLFIAVSLLGSGFPLPSRYGISLMPGMAASVAVLLRTRRVDALVLVFAVSTLASLLIFPPKW